MTQLKIQLPNEIKIFNINKENTEEYNSQKIEIENYLKYNTQTISLLHGDYTIQAVPIMLDNNIPSYWCGYIISDDRSKLNQLLTFRNIHGGWTYDDNNKIGFDCAHSYDLVFLFGIDELDNFNNSQLENYTYKSPEWVIQELKNYINI